MTIRCGHVAGGQIAVAALLFLGAAGAPLWYYPILRCIVTSVALVGVFAQAAERSKLLTGCLVFLAILFNPLFPFYLPRDVWAQLDAVAGILFLVSAVSEVLVNIWLMRHMGAPIDGIIDLTEVVGQQAPEKTAKYLLNGRRWRRLATAKRREFISREWFKLALICLLAALVCQMCAISSEYRYAARISDSATQNPSEGLRGFTR